MSKIKFGPSGLGGVKQAIDNLEMFSKLGLKACEINFTYQIYIKKKEDAGKIKRAAKKFGIRLSIHAPYWINLNSDDFEKVEASKKRILDSCKVAHWLDAEFVVFHCGFFGKKDARKSKISGATKSRTQDFVGKEESYFNIKGQILEMQKEIKKNKWDVKLAPETTGKVNVFGSVEEIARLVDETGCGFCLDFAHILAREKKIEWKKIKKLFPQKHWHCHFSGIEFSEKGEKHHKKTDVENWKRILSNLPKNKIITIINESPSPVEDSILGLKIWESKNTK